MLYHYYLLTAAYQACNRIPSCGGIVSLVAAHLGSRNTMVGPIHNIVDEARKNRIENQNKYSSLDVYPGIEPGIGSVYCWVNPTYW